jgi:hypothetical protein
MRSPRLSFQFQDQNIQVLPGVRFISFGSLKTHPDNAKEVMDIAVLRAFGSLGFASLCNRMHPYDERIA